MRTTLAIDDDVLQVVVDRARAQKSTAGKVLSELARQALQSADSIDVSTLPKRNGFPQLPSRGVMVTTESVNRLLDDIDY